MDAGTEPCGPRVVGVRRFRRNAPYLAAASSRIESGGKSPHSIIEPEQALGVPGVGLLADEDLLSVEHEVATYDVLGCGG